MPVKLKKVELIQEMRRWMISITGDARETIYLSQQLYVRGITERDYSLISEHCRHQLVHYANICHFSCHCLHIMRAGSPRWLKNNNSSYEIPLSMDIICNNNHLLFNLLPPPSTPSQNYNLRTRTYSQQLPQRTGHLTDWFFFTRMLFRVIY